MHAHMQQYIIAHIRSHTHTDTLCLANFMSFLKFGSREWNKASSFDWMWLILSIIYLTFGWKKLIKGSCSCAAGWRAKASTRMCVARELFLWILKEDIANIWHIVVSFTRSQHIQIRIQWRHCTHMKWWRYDHVCVAANKIDVRKNLRPTTSSPSSSSL